MPIFCPKKIKAPEKLGDKLRSAREKMKWSLTELSTQTGVAEKYLDALEKGRYQALPKTGIFRLAYLKTCLRTLNLEPKSALKQFYNESGMEGAQHKSDITKIKKPPLLVPHMLFRNSAVILIMAIFIFYLGWQVKGILREPKLIVYTPAEGMVSGQLNILVQGQSEKEVRLTINGQDAMLGENGIFATAVDLSNGVNTITITATKKHGKTTTIIRHVVVNKADDKFSLK